LNGYLEGVIGLTRLNEISAEFAFRGKQIYTWGIEIPLSTIACDENGRKVEKIGYAKSAF